MGPPPGSRQENGFIARFPRSLGPRRRRCDPRRACVQNERILSFSANLWILRMICSMVLPVPSTGGTLARASVADADLRTGPSSPRY
ncbi:hypothetical protein HMPREF9598_00469 [Cutibacterium acnes HL050PA1]|nr:hypothetical protein HMPREF9567_00789 [Cutibacterium acnes HL013PA1]EFS82853.1 hypothetical protein HMPREF9598_00469 [Cutibacterium acnes HL050PA1]